MQHLVFETWTTRVTLLTFIALSKAVTGPAGSRVLARLADTPEGGQAGWWLQVVLFIINIFFFHFVWCSFLRNQR